MLLTQKAYAERRGWSKQYVHQLVRQGKIALTGGMVDAEAADAALDDLRDPGRSAAFRGRMDMAGGEAQRLSGTFAKARTLREHYEALRAKLEYEAASGALVRRDEVVAAAMSAGRRYRDAMRLAAGPIAQALAERFGTEARDMRDLVLPHIDAALLELAQALEGEEFGFGEGVGAEAAGGDPSTA